MDKSRHTEIHLAKKAKSTKKSGGSASGKSAARPAGKSANKSAGRPASKPVTKAAWKAAAGVKAGAKTSKKVARKKVPVPAKKKVAAARGKGPKTANAARRRLGTKALANAGAVMSTAGAGGAAGAGAERVGEALTAQQRAARTFAIEAAQMLADDKCTDVVVLDVRGMNSLADYIVVATGTSDRQMRFCALNLKDKAEAMGHGVARKNEDERTTWVVLDCMDVVVHIFEPNTRAHYDIENMWADALKVEWARAAGTRPPGLARRG